MSNGDPAPLELRFRTENGLVVIEIRPAESPEWHELRLDPGLAAQLVLSVQTMLARLAQP